MRLNDVREIDRDFLSAAEVADVLGSDAHAIRIQAREDPEALGFPVCRIGNRVKIPRLAFIKFMEGGQHGA